MPDRAIPAMERQRLFSRFWRSARGFWVGPSARIVWLLTALFFAGVLLDLALHYRLNVWTRDFFDALERKDGQAIGRQALLFLPLAAATIALASIAVWGRMTAQRAWRRWLTGHLIDLWLANDRFRRLERIADAPGNPEYRIAEDARVATDAPIDFVVGIVRSTLTAAIFIGVLWTVGGDIVVDTFGGPFTLPGYLVIAAIVYALATTLGMMAIGRRLVAVVEDRNDAEAELRRAASRVRESGAPRDDAEKHAALRAAVAPVIARWRALCGQLMRTTLISEGNTLLAPVVALFLCAPKYLAGTMSLGEVTQAAAAFFAVQAAFNWLVHNYPRIADWRSAVNRVAALLLALDELHPVGKPRDADRQVRLLRPAAAAND